MDYLQCNAKEITELGNHEISLLNFKTVSPYPTKQTYLNELFCYIQINTEKSIFFSFFYLLALKGPKQHPHIIIDYTKFPELNE